MEKGNHFEAGNAVFDRFIEKLKSLYYIEPEILITFHCF